MSTFQKEIDIMLNCLPAEEQRLAYEFIKRMVLAWDPDFTKVTPQEREAIERAENSGFIPEEDVDWDNLEKYAEQ